ncbi:hypothetical protein AAG906_000984 [Vitis piasezkii]
MEEEMFCYIHEGGEFVKIVVRSVEYKGGQTNCIVVCKNISHSEFVSKVYGELDLEPNSIKLDFTVKFDSSCLLPLHNDVDIVKMFKFNDMFCRAYIFQCNEGGDGFICPTSALTPIVALNSTHVSYIGKPPLHMSNKSPTIESFGFSQRCAKKKYHSTSTKPVRTFNCKDLNIVQVHTFRNLHNHCLEDVALSQPLVRSTCASLVIDDVIRSTPEY